METLPSLRPVFAPRRRIVLATLALSVLRPAAAASGAPRIVASFSILADMVREVAPPDFEVTALVGADADAHVFEPRPADARRLAQADLVVVNGLGFEGWIDRLVRVSGYAGPVAVASQGIRPRQGGHHGIDPHAWHDLAHARHYVGQVVAALVARWPERGAEIRARGADYQQRLAALEARVRQWFAAIPRGERRVITSHAAYGYFGDAYEVEFLAPRGWSPDSEPSAAAVARLVREIRAQRVRALFVENISDPRLLERIAQESGVRIGGRLYSDALSAPGGPADTYLKLFEHNARTLAAALGS